MELYHGSHGEHVLAYKKHIERVVNDAISEFPRTMALRVDVHYPPILDRGDTVCCFPNLEPGAISRFLNRPGFPGECFICELRLPDHRFRWKHNKLFLLLPEEYGPAFPAIVDCYTSPPT